MSFHEIATGRFLRRGLLLLGLWPVANGTSSLYRRFYRCYQIFLHVTLTFTITLLVWLNVIWAVNLDKAIGILRYAMTGIVILSKVLNTSYYAPLAWELLHEFEINTALAPHTDAELEMWRRAQRVYRKVIIIYLTCANSVLVIASLPFLFVKDRSELPIDFWVPVEWREYSIWPRYFYALVSGSFACMSNMFIDLFQCYLLLNLMLYLKLIGSRLERLSEAHGNEEITRRLVKIILMHRQIKRMIQCCENIISIPVLSQITLSSLIICFTIYNMQNKSFTNNPVDFLSMILYVLTMALQIFLPCYYANGITAQAERLSHQLYSCSWICMSSCNRRLILLFTKYLQQPIVLEAGGYFQIGLPIFTKTMNNAYTLLAVIWNVRNDKASK